MSELNQVKQEIANMNAKMHKVNFLYRIVLRRRLKSKYKSLLILKG